MSEPTERELRRIAWCMTETAHFGRSIRPDPPTCAEIPRWRMDEARAAYALGARHDGDGSLHGPVRNLGERR
jgi:hypothetical protein